MRVGRYSCMPVPCIQIFSVFIFIREFSYRIFIEDAEYVEIDGVVSVAGGAVCA